MKTYVDKIEERRRLKTKELRKDMRNESDRLFRLLLKSGFKFKGLYLFGSAIKKGYPLWGGSDIDLVIKGLNKDFFFRAYALLLKNAKFKVDLKPFEDLEDIFRRKVLKEAETLYEKK